LIFREVAALLGDVGSRVDLTRYCFALIPCLRSDQCRAKLGRAEHTRSVWSRADQAQIRTYQCRSGQIRSKQICTVQIWTEHGRQCRDAAMQIYADDG